MMMSSSNGYYYLHKRPFFQRYQLSIFSEINSETHIYRSVCICVFARQDVCIQLIRHYGRFYA